MLWQSFFFPTSANISRKKLVSSFFFFFCRMFLCELISLLPFKRFQVWLHFHQQFIIKSFKHIEKLKQFDSKYPHSHLLGFTVLTFCFMCSITYLSIHLAVNLCYYFVAFLQELRKYTCDCILLLFCFSGLTWWCSPHHHPQISVCSWLHFLEVFAQNLPPQWGLTCVKLTQF